MIPYQADASPQDNARLQGDQRGQTTLLLHCYGYQHRLSMVGRRGLAVVQYKTGKHRVFRDFAYYFHKLFPFKRTCLDAI
jgi:hypothetical protein